MIAVEGKLEPGWGLIFGEIDHIKDFCVIGPFDLFIDPFFGFRLSL